MIHYRSYKQNLAAVKLKAGRKFNLERDSYYDLCDTVAPALPTELTSPQTESCTLCECVIYPKMLKNTRRYEDMNDPRSYIYKLTSSKLAPYLTLHTAGAPEI